MMYFPNAFASAPSSVMSCASMLTGIPSYFIAKNYDEFKYNNENFTSLPNLLSQNGYDVASSFVAQEMQIKYGSFLNHVQDFYFPDGVEFNKDEIPSLRGTVWKNETLRSICLNYLQDRNKKSKIIKKPLFMMNWFNVREDPNTSQIISNHLQDLKNLGYYKNSIIFVLSDHGYLDAKRGWTAAKLAEANLSHDLMLSDDNIKVPFFLYYPNCKPGKYDNMVSTYDIFPTVLDLLSLNVNDNMLPIAGESIVNKSHQIKQKERYLRSDARFFEQGFQCTAIRSSNFKYIKKEWGGGDEFFNLRTDPLEQFNLLNQKKYSEEISRHKIEFEKSQAMYVAYMVLKKILNALKSNNLKYVELEYPLKTSSDQSFILEYLQENPSLKYKLVLNSNLKKDYFNIINPSNISRNRSIIEKINMLQLITYKNKKRSLKAILKIIWAKRKIYFNNPSFFLRDILNYLSRIFK